MITITCPNRGRAFQMLNGEVVRVTMDDGRIDVGTVRWSGTFLELASAGIRRSVDYRRVVDVTVAP
jgi:hypothetical protein